MRVTAPGEGRRRYLVLGSNCVATGDYKQPMTSFVRIGPGLRDGVEEQIGDRRVGGIKPENLPHFLDLG